MRRQLPFAIAVAVALAGCSSKQHVAPLASAAPPATPIASAPAGYGNLVVPARLADGSYATPNRSVSAAGAVWHLRAGLNVAALSCRGAEEAALIASYNALIQRHRTAFDQAYRALASEYGSVAAFDQAMTALYNYYALPPARLGLCAAAQAVLTDAAAVPAGELVSFAPTALARIDRPYTQIFAAQDIWLADRMTPTATQIAAVSAPASSRRANPVTPDPAPRIAVDPAVLRLP